MKKIIIIFLSVITINANAQLQTVTNGTGNNITTNPIIINGDGAATGIYVGHGLVSTSNSQDVNKNTAVGFQAIGTASTPPSGSQAGFYNSAFGYQSLNLLATGTYNSAFGSSSLAKLTSGTKNTAFGSYSLLNNISGGYNVAVGNNALSAANSYYNTAVGSGALANTTSGSNTALGCNALSSVTNGSGNNIGIGNGAQIITQSYGLSIGNSIYGINIGTANANIGIGAFTSTILPSAKLDIMGNLKIRTVTQGTPSNTNYLFVDATGEVKQAAFPSASGITNSCTTSNIVPISNASGNLSCGNIWNDGTNVGIGTTTPTEQLHTTGGVRFEGITNAPLSASTYHVLYIDDNGKLFKNSPYAYRMSNSSQTQQEIDNLKAEVNTLKEQIAELLKIKSQTVTLNESKLFQNTPNPFNSVTKIEYFVTNEQNNFISISNLEGKPIKSVKLNGKGKGILELNAGSLPSGTYTYSLYSNGVLADTKLMVISK